MLYKAVVFFILILINLVFHLNALSVDKLDSNNVVVRIKHTDSTHPKIIAEARATDKNLALIATVSLDPSGNKTGWNILDTWTNGTYDNGETAYWVGYCEGSISAHLIWAYYYNTLSNFCNGQEEVCDKMKEFIKENINWIKKMVVKHKDHSEYWWQVYLITQQYEGMAMGYLEAELQQPPLTLLDLYFLNMRGDLYDLLEKFKPKGSPPRKIYDDGHCSAIIKLLPNNKDLYVSHTTWTRYATMIRVAKRYQLNHSLRSSSKRLIPGHTTTLSSYPGVLLSMDDFYTTSSRLAVQETTTGNYNDKLWKHVQPQGIVFNFIRVQIANRLATDGRSWSKIYSKYNSGTYNNQWMVVDYNKFTPGKPPKKDLLWILEQIPGHIVAEDKTEILTKQSYWPSYNIPYYKKIFKMSGYGELAAKYGDWFTYEGSPRAKIMKRDHMKIKCPCTLMNFMRYNDYKNDPYSRCQCTPPYSAANAIAARKDLNPANGTYFLPYLGHAAVGATDVKYVNSTLIRSQHFIGVVGPSTGTNLPTFKWSTSDFGDSVPHLGQPDEFNFKPILIHFDYQVV